MLTTTGSEIGSLETHLHLTSVKPRIPQEPPLFFPKCIGHLLALVPCSVNEQHKYRVGEED